MEHNTMLLKRSIIRCMESIYCISAAIFITLHSDKCSTGRIWGISDSDILIARAILNTTLTVICVLISVFDDSLHGEASPSHGTIHAIETGATYTLYFAWWLIAWILVLNPTNMACLIKDDIGAALFFIAAVYETMYWIARWHRAILIAALIEYDKRRASPEASGDPATNHTYTNV